MIKNKKTLQRFERNLIRNTYSDPLKNFQILNAMYEEAVALGVIPLRNKLEGIEVDLRIAKVVNSVR